MSKLIIPKENLPVVNAATNTVNFRFRIITDDRNVFSYWSPIYSLDPKMYFIPGTIYSPGSLTLSKIGSSSSISMSWDSVSIRKSVKDLNIEDPYSKINITNAQFNSTTGLITYVVNNNFVVGQTVSVYGCSDFRFNFEEGKVFSRTSTSFTFQPASTTLNNGNTSTGGKVIGKSSLIGELSGYDLWVRWSENGPSNYSPWTYKERVSSTSVTINIPSSYLDSSGTLRTSAKNVNVELYRPGNPINRDNASEFLMYSGTLGF